MNLAQLGWNNVFQQQAVNFLTDTVIPVRVLDVHRSGWHVIGEATDTLIPPVIENASEPATVGDWLLLDTSTGKAILLLDRLSVFKRRAPGTDRREQLIAANVDTLFVVSSCNEDFNEARLERYLAIGRDAEVMTLIVLTKSDLCPNPEDYVRRAAKLAVGVHAEALNALDMETAGKLEPWLGLGQTVALLGSSGVGKSTLSNTLLGSSNIETRQIRKDDAKGRHTTTARNLHQLPGGAWLLDTPGMRELQLTDVRSGIDDVFAEITALAGDCRFDDCCHQGEPGCAVQQAVGGGELDAARLQRWQKLVREDAHNRESIAERRARGKALGRLYRTIQNESRGRKNRS